MGWDGAGTRGRPRLLSPEAKRRCSSYRESRSWAPSYVGPESRALALRLRRGVVAAPCCGASGSSPQRSSAAQSNPWRWSSGREPDDRRGPYEDARPIRRDLTEKPARKARSGDLGAYEIEQRSDPLAADADHPVLIGTRVGKTRR